MDDALSTEDLNLASVTNRGELATLLQKVHLKADKPSLRTLEALTRHKQTPLSKTAVSEMLKGVRLPRKAVMVAFLETCGVRGDHLTPWVTAWERIAVGSSDLSSRPSIGPISSAVSDPQAGQLRDQVNQLSADNDRLRLQLIAMDRQRGEQESRLADAASARAAHSPIAARRELGVLLRALRKEKGLTIEEVAKHLMCSVGKVRGMEASFRAGTPRDVRDLCDLYDLVGEAQRGRMMKLAEEGKKRGWWQAYGLAYDICVGLEEEAERISAFQSSVIHGLLQTADYARAGHEGAMPRLNPDQIELQIEAKLTRQRILKQDSSAQFAAVLDESALRRVVGGPKVMAAQLARVLEMSALPNVIVQVLPFARGAHPALESNFAVLELPVPTPGIVYVEGLRGPDYLEEPKDLRRYREIFSCLQSMALSPEDTADLIAGLGDSYADGINEDIRSY